MRIVNGKWVDSYGNQVNKNDLNGQQLMDIARGVVSLYDNDITYDRISIVCSLYQRDTDVERTLAGVLENNLLEKFKYDIAREIKS